MRILLTDTTWNMAILAKELRDAGVFVSEAADGGEVMEYVRSGQQDAILIDPDLPDGCAIDLVRRIRSLNGRVTVCLVQRNQGETDLTRAIGAGADDIILWPETEIAEITARLRAYVRRAAGFATTQIRIADLTIDLESQTLSLLDLPVHLTRLEYELIETLALRHGSLVSREAIMCQLYAWQDEPDPKIIDVYICRLRAKIAAAGAEGDIIVTSFAQGYRLNTMPNEVRPLAA